MISFKYSPFKRILKIQFVIGLKTTMIWEMLIMAHSYTVFFFFVCVCVFLGPHLPHLEVPSLGVESELQLPVYAIATATLHLSCVCDLHHSSQQHCIPSPLSKVKDPTHILMDTSQICFCYATMGTLPLTHF